MKKMLFKTLTLALVAMTTVVGLSSCEDPKKNPDPGGASIEGLVVSGVAPTFNGVSFSVDASPAVAIAYLCLPEGQTATAKEVFEKGEPKGVIKGTFAVKNLKPSTRYTLFVAKRNQVLEGPVSVAFTTTENSGTPATPKSAGVRVESIDKTTMTVEIINGAEADYSYTAVWPEAYVENFVYEGEKNGMSREDYLKGLVVTYPYFCALTVGRGKSGIYDYTKDFGEAKGLTLLPAADYMIVSLGMIGDPALGKDGTVGDVTVTKIRTGDFDLIGKPRMTVDKLFADYIRIRYKFNPGADAACYAFYGTYKAEIDEFVTHFDKVRGEGEGQRMLKEFIRFIDANAPQNTAPLEYSLTLGFDQANKDFQMLALPMDKNMMPGEMVSRVDQVLPVPENQVDADFELKVDQADKGLGATNYWYSLRFGKNCANIFWRILTESEYEAELKKFGSAKGYARELWYNGWGEDRPSNKNQSIEHKETHFRWGVTANKSYVVVATALNYTGGLVDAKIVDRFKTKSVNYDGGYAPQMEIEVSEVGKTSVRCRYFVPEGIDANKPRVLRHIIFEEGDPFLDLTDTEFKSMLYQGRSIGGDSPVVLGNEFSVYSIDEEDIASPYDWDFAWSGMESGTKYVYTWLTEDNDGYFSDLKRITFSTSRNDGGQNPKVAISIDPKSIGETEDKKWWGCIGKFVPNGDVTTYNILFTDRWVMNTHYPDADTKEEIEAALYSLLMQNGMTGYIDATSIDSYQCRTESQDGWATTICYGAGRKEGKFTYLHFTRDGKVGEVIEVPVPSSKSAAIRYLAPLRGLEALKARHDRARKNMGDVEVLPPFATGEPQAYEVMKPEVKEIQIRSMKDITMDVLSHGTYKK